MDREFERLLNSASQRHSKFRVWDDFIHMAAIAIANSCDFQHEREDLYLNIASRYDKEELEKFAQMLALTVNRLEENRKQDYLGQLYMEFGFGDVKKGQYFTPYDIAEMMVNLAGLTKAEKPYITVNDPCSGSGVMLIAALNRMIEANKDPHTDIFIVAQDSDPCIAMMCYVQLSLLGAAGYVIIGDSLMEPATGDVLRPPKNAWKTPMYYHPIWEFRRLG